MLLGIPQHLQLIAMRRFYDLDGFTSADHRNAFFSRLAAEWPLEMLPNDQNQANGHLFAAGILTASVNGRQVY